MEFSRWAEVANVGSGTIEQLDDAIHRPPAKTSRPRPEPCCTASEADHEVNPLAVGPVLESRSGRTPNALGLISNSRNPSLGNGTHSSFPKRWGCRCMTAAARIGSGLSRISPVSFPDLSEEDCSLDGIMLTAILPVSRDPSSTNRFLEMVHLTPCSRPSFRKHSRPCRRFGAGSVTCVRSGREAIFWNRPGVSA